MRRCCPGWRRRLGANGTVAEKGRSNEIPATSVGKGGPTVARPCDGDDDGACGWREGERAGRGRIEVGV